MLAIDKTIQTLRKQLAGFNASSRLLVGALMVILVMTLVLVATFTGRSNMAPLGMRGSLSAEARAQAINYLDYRGVPWEERNGQIMVPTESRYGLLADLAENQLITTDQIDFASVFSDDSPFVDRDTKNRRYLVAKMNEVARMISELSGIERASVMIDQPSNPGGLGKSHVDPSASVNVRTTEVPLSRSQADAIARMVAGAHAKLKVQHVTVVDARTGKRVQAPTDDEIFASQYYERKIAAENHARRTIAEALAMIPGVTIAVNAQVDATQEERTSRTYQDPKLGATEESKRETTATNQRNGGEPGVRPNTGVQLNSTSGSTSQTSDTQDKTKFLPFVGELKSHTRDPKGYAVKINATISVPKSYFVRLYKDQNGPEVTDPDQTALDALVASESTRIERIVQPLIDTGAVEGAVAGTVLVSMFADFAIDGAGPGGASATLASGGGMLSGGLIKTVGLAALAVVSLGFMFFLVRRAGGEEELPSPEELVGIPPALAEANTDLVGEAAESEAAMEGMEIDDESIRQQQVLEQINDYASTNPDEAATLLRKWIRSDH